MIKGTADLTPKRKGVVTTQVDDQVVVDAESEHGVHKGQDSETPEDTPAVHEEL